jgi:hypothetical protein
MQGFCLKRGCPKNPMDSHGYHHFPYSSGHLWLVGGFNPSEKYEFVSWGYYSQYMESQKNHGSKPPTRYIVIPINNHY